MKSISFPKMFSKNTTKLVEDHKATAQNLKLLLTSEQGELLDDPEFGVKLKAYMFDQNNYILRDILVDEIYTQIATFMPQIKLERKDISITSEGSTCSVNIRATNLLNYKTDMYNIALFEIEQ